MVRRKQVCIIGAGVSGLAAAKAFAARGHQITIVERSGDLGGVWEPARSYPEVQTQSPKDLYRYTDKAMPESYPEWPKGPQVHAYLTEYARDHDLLARSASTRPCCRWIAAPIPGRAGGSICAGRTAVSSRRIRFRRRLHRPVQRAPDAQPARRRVFQGAGRAHPALVAIQRSGDCQRPQGRRARRLEIGDRHRGQRGQFRRRRSDTRLPRAGMADSLFHRRPGQFQAHSLHPRPGGDVPKLGHRRAVAVRACDRKAVSSGPTGAGWKAC